MNLHFITNVQLKNIIGKDLINNDNIAILYLEHPNNQNQPEIPNHKPLIDNTF